MGAAFLGLFLLTAEQVKVQVPRQPLTPENPEERYGPPTQVPLSALAAGSFPCSDRAVRTKGVLEYDAERWGEGRSPRPRAYRLRDRGDFLPVHPASGLESTFGADGPNLIGFELEMVGVCKGGLEFWRYLPISRTARAGTPGTITIADLARDPRSFVGKKITVTGQFRGRNLYGDLPARTQLSPGDWVVAQDGSAVWVTGRPPKGSGWKLDPDCRSDTRWTVAVVGRGALRGGVLYLQASEVKLVGLAALAQAEK
jgi:hypothetical protein